MPINNFETDEDRMIYQLELHRDLTSYICSCLDKASIPYKKTVGNDQRGDVLLIERKDIPAVKDMINQLDKKFHNMRP